MTENTLNTAKTTATETAKTVKSAVSHAFTVPRKYAEYCETRAETQTVELFKPSKNAVRINSDDCAGDRRAYRTVIAEKLDGLCVTRHAYTWALSKVLYGVVTDAYKTRTPWKVTEILCAMQEKHFSRMEIERFCTYFELAGFDVQKPRGADGIPVCNAIRDAAQQAAVFEKMRKVNAFDLKIRGGDPEQTRAKAAASGDAAKRIRDGLNRAAASAKKNSEASKDPEDKKLFERERALALATKEILSFVSYCEDPRAVLVEFKAWFESNHAKELKAKNEDEAEKLIKAGKA